MITYLFTFFQGYVAPPKLYTHFLVLDEWYVHIHKYLIKKKIFLITAVGVSIQRGEISNTYNIIIKDGFLKEW